jgi:hypothetical protein
MEKYQCNRIENTLIACRVPKMLRERIEAYSQEKDLSVSQIIRLGIRMVMDLEKAEKPSQWLVSQ